MNDTTQTLLRSVLKIGAGYLGSKGYADDSTLELASAGLMAIFAIIWGIMHRKSAQATQSATVSILAALAIGLGGSAFCGVALTGCSSTPARISFNAASVTQTTVEQAMTAWGDYVREYAPPVDQEEKVQAAYERYQQTMTAVIDANKVYIALVASGQTNSAPDAQARIDQVTQRAALALSEIVELVRTFTTPAKP